MEKKKNIKSKRIKENSNSNYKYFSLKLYNIHVKWQHMLMKYNDVYDRRTLTPQWID